VRLRCACAALLVLSFSCRLPVPSRDSPARWRDGGAACLRRSQPQLNSRDAQAPPRAGVSDSAATRRGALSRAPSPRWMLNSVGATLTMDRATLAAQPHVDGVHWVTTSSGIAGAALETCARSSSARRAIVEAPCVRGMVDIVSIARQRASYDREPRRLRERVEASRSARPRPRPGTACLWDCGYEDTKRNASLDGLGACAGRRRLSKPRDRRCRVVVEAP